MSRIAFVNGVFLPLEDAKISVLDRGFLFADGIYEVCAVVDGRLIDNEAHLLRLDRCLRDIAIPNPFPTAVWHSTMEELLTRNGLREGLVYLEVTRGAAERDFSYPPGMQPTVVMFTLAKRIVDAPLAETGAAVITVPDLRWKRRDIKSVGLLAQVMAKQAAVEAGVAEAWMVEDGFVTEGSSSNAFIIARGSIITRPLSPAILPGITRRAVMQLSAEHGLTVEERLFSVEEALQADEAFFTSASSFVMPVVAIDGQAVGRGRPGDLTRRMRRLYLEMAGVTQGEPASERPGP